jgi:hypothetical protein
VLHLDLEWHWGRNLVFAGLVLGTSLGLADGGLLEATPALIHLLLWHKILWSGMQLCHGSGPGVRPAEARAKRRSWPSR